MKIASWSLVFGLGLIVVGCGEKGEGPIVPPPPAPGEYADKHMPADWWTDEAKVEEGRKLFIGETNPDVNCASCHGKDGKPVKAGARDFRVTDRMKLYSDSVWFWRISEGVPNTKMKAWKSKFQRRIAGSSLRLRGTSVWPARVGILTRRNGWRLPALGQLLQRNLLQLRLKHRPKRRPMHLLRLLQRPRPGNSLF